MRKKIIAGFIVLVASLSVQPGAQTQVIGGQTAALVSADESTIRVRQETFDVVWRTVKEKHFDPNLGGVDWDSVREKYSPRVATLKSDDELYQLLQEMLGELGQSHFSIVPPHAIVEDGTREPPTGGVGIDVEIIDGSVVITKVDGDSSASRAGLRTGFIITRADDADFSRLSSAMSRAREPLTRTRLKVKRAALARINGEPGSTVKLQYRDHGDVSREAVLERRRLKGEMSPALGNFPPQYTEFETRTLDGGIGYIRFNVFVPILMDRIRQAIRSMSGAPGLIIDLRGNPGGLGAMSRGVAGLLSTQTGSLGTMTMRSGHLNFLVSPQREPYKGPVVVLIDNGSGSTTEILAAGLQEMGRAVIVGERSVGAALPSVFEKLPTGALFQYAIADFRTPGGVLIEGRGVIPDIEVKWDRQWLLAGRDLQLETAVREIRNGNAPAAGKRAA